MCEQESYNFRCRICNETSTIDPKRRQHDKYTADEICGQCSGVIRGTLAEMEYDAYVRANPLVQGPLDEEREDPSLGCETETGLDLVQGHSGRRSRDS